MRTALDTVLAALRDHDCGPKRSGAGWTARCPAHDDYNPSLSIGVGEDGRALIHCQAGCDTSNVLKEIGLKQSDLFTKNNGKSYKNTHKQRRASNPEAEKTPGKKTDSKVWPTLEAALAQLRPEKSWTYTDAMSEPVGAVLRWDRHNGKSILPLRHDRDGWRLKAMEAPRNLYNLPALSGSPIGETIFIVEGEKCADATRSLGLVATTSAGGCKAPHKTDWAPLAGKECVILPDNDDAGRAYAEKVASILSTLQPAPSVRIVELSGLPFGGDIVEFIEAPGDDVNAARMKLDELIALAPAIAPSDMAVAVQKVTVQDDDAWPDPLPLPAPLPPVEPFDPKLLPVAFEPWITDIAERMQCPPDFPAVAAMIATAGVIGRKIGIRPKQFDDWLVAPNLWGVLIGRPSIMKTPPLREVMRPVRQLIMAADNSHHQEMIEHRMRAQELSLKKAAMETSVKSKLRKPGGEAEQELKALRDITGDLDAAPPMRHRYVVNDATVQALSEVMAENPNGVILVRDELIGFLKSLDMESQQAARAFYLEAWDGAGSFESDRIGRGNTRVDAVCLSLVGTCQPGPLGEYLSQAIRGGIGDDGLMQRFQLAVWPDDPGPWVNVDRFPDSKARDAAFAVFDRLDTLDAAGIGGETDLFDPTGIPFVRLKDDAYDRFIDWMTERENRLRSGAEPPAIESHLTKYRSLIPSIALVSHLVDGGVGKVTLDALDRAIGWGQYLQSHSRRIYAQGIEPSLRAAHALAKKILEGELASGFALRDVYRPNWSLLDGKTEARGAVDCLIDLDWLKPQSVATGGAPKTIYHVNPSVVADGFKPFAHP